jgi:hypothetical protein
LHPGHLTETALSSLTEGAHALPAASILHDELTAILDFYRHLAPHHVVCIFHARRLSFFLICEACTLRLYLGFRILLCSTLMVIMIVTLVVSTLRCLNLGRTLQQMPAIDDPCNNDLIASLPVFIRVLWTVDQDLVMSLVIVSIIQDVAT